MPRIFDNIDQQLLPALREEFVRALRGDELLTISHEDRKHADPQIICSLGLRSDV